MLWSTKLVAIEIQMEVMNIMNDLSGFPLRSTWCIRRFKPVMLQHFNNYWCWLSSSLKARVNFRVFVSQNHVIFL